MSDAVAHLLGDIIARTRARHPDRPALIGLSGAQGSGKSTVCRAVEAASGGRIAYFSLDDVYRTRAERERMALKRPLLLTRGPPGSHDLALVAHTIAMLSERVRDPHTLLPRFDKARDDRAPRTKWPLFMGNPDAVLIDGWCLGALPIENGPPLNALEAREDEDGVWRKTMLGALAGPYQDFFASFDQIVYLQAPSFDIVRRWRGEQEEKMLGRALTEAEGAALDRFIQHYERITRAMLAGGHGACWIVRLDENRRVLRIEQRD